MKVSTWWRWASVMQRRAWWVIGAWVALLVALTVGANAVGSDYRIEGGLDNSAAQVAAAKVTAGAEYQDTIAVVWQGPESDAGKVDEVLARVAQIPGVKEVGPAILISSEDGMTHGTSITLAGGAFDLPEGSLDQIISAVESAPVPAGLIGDSVRAASASSQTLAEVLGFIAAGIILILAFGSLLAAGLPLATAFFALIAAFALTTFASHITSIPPFASALVSLITIGVGIDYAMFIVARHRAGLISGKSVHDSVNDAFDTSGRAVVFAGIAVILCLGALLILGIPFISGIAVAIAIGVAISVIATWTLLPAFLGLIGNRVLSRKVREGRASQGRGWERWALLVERHSVIAIVGTLLLLGVFAAPALGIRLGYADAGTDQPGSITRVGYDIMAEGFGPGAGSPILAVFGPGDEATYEAIAALPGVSTIGMMETNDEVSWAQVIATTSPQDPATQDLLQAIRDVGATPSGAEALKAEFTDLLQERLVWFLVWILGVSSLLLMWVFRSIAIPIKAALMNVFAAAASLGIVVAVYQTGWAVGPFGQAAGPIESFLPVTLIAILFGLSMDYQVFLMCRIREEWVHGRDNDHAVASGLADTGRVITAAAGIMVCVFLAFALSGERGVSQMGLGLAVAIFIDAFIVRSLLVPALMHTLGDWNWWLPGWLDRLLPQLRVEGPDKAWDDNLVDV